MKDINSALAQLGVAKLEEYLNMVHLSSYLHYTLATISSMSVQYSSSSSSSSKSSSSSPPIIDLYC